MMFSVEYGRRLEAVLAQELRSLGLDTDDTDPRVISFASTLRGSIVGRDLKEAVRDIQTDALPSREAEIFDFPSGGSA